MKKAMSVLLIAAMLCVTAGCSSYETVSEIPPAAGGNSAEPDYNDDDDDGDYNRLAAEEHQEQEDDERWAENWEDPYVILNTVNGELEFKLKSARFCYMLIDLTFEHEEKDDIKLNKLVGNHWDKNNPNTYFLKFKDGKKQEFFSNGSMDHKRPKSIPVTFCERRNDDNIIETLRFR